MKLNILKYEILALFIFLIFGEINIAYGTITSTPVKVVVTIVDGATELIEKIDENLYQGIVENTYNCDIVFTSDSDIKSFPKRIVIKPGEKQMFKFIATNKNKIKLSYDLMGKTIFIKTYSDLYSKN